MSICERLHDMRTQKGVTLAALCKATDIPLRTYQNYESGIREISVKALCKLADFYGVTTDYLLGREVNHAALILASLSDTDKALLSNYSALSGKARDDFIATINRIFSGVAPDVPSIPELDEIDEYNYHVKQCEELEELQRKKDVLHSG